MSKIIELDKIIALAVLSTGQLAHSTSKRSLLEGLFDALLSLGLCLAPLSHRVPVPAPDVHELPLECSFAYV